MQHRELARGIAVAFGLAAGLWAQPSSNDVMGFETTAAWTASGNNSSGTTISATSNRTQGRAAYQVMSAPNLLKLSSSAVSNTATALAGVGDGGASFYVDVLVPAVQGNAVNSGHIQLFLSAPSRGLNRVALGQLSLNGYTPGKYSTLMYPIPTAVQTALGGATFTDLTFEVDVNSPGKVTGPYVFDNLRVHDVQLVQNPTGQAPPPGYGGSVDLVVIGSTPATQGFGMGGVQIPNGFHLKLGTAGGTNVQLELGLDGSPSFTCLYGPDTTDASGHSFIYNSCTGGNQPGDIVGANWVDLRILNGNLSQKIRAQLSLNALGDQLGQQLLPPMPTFWGDADQCVPQPQPGVVVTTSPSCTAQFNEGEQIFNDYFNKLNNSNPAPGWIVTPVPEWAKRHGNGTPSNNLAGPPPGPGDPPFSYSGDLNPGGSFDATWDLSGSYSIIGYPGTDRETTHLDGSFGAAAFALVDSINVINTKVTADVDRGETTPDVIAPNYSGTLQLYIFGQQIYNDTFDPSTTISYDKTKTVEKTLLPIQIWIFSIKIGVSITAELSVQGTLKLLSGNMTVTPSGAIGAHVSGGIDLGAASGDVDAIIELATLSVPVTAKVKVVPNNDPSVCALVLDGSVQVDLTLSSLGGLINLDATFGYCPFCKTYTKTIFQWDGLDVATWNMMNYTFDTQLSPLPASMCKFPISVSITSPISGATLTSGFKYGLTGNARPTDASLPSDSTYAWKLTPGTATDTVSVISGSGKSTEVVQFGAPTSGNTGTWTINLDSTVTVKAASGTVITVSGSATPVPITVTSLGNGVYLTDIVNNADGTISIPDGSGTFTVVNTNSTGVKLDGLVVGGSGTLNTTFSATVRSDLVPAGYCNGASAGTFTVSGGDTTSPSATWTGFATCPYQVTLTTTAGGSSYATTSPVVWITSNQ